jgi:hypothetical protein
MLLVLSELGLLSVCSLFSLLLAEPTVAVCCVVVAAF